MKVCMIAYSFYELDNRVRRYSETLVRKGFTVDAVALQRADLPKIEIINGVKVHRIQKRTRNEKVKYLFFIKIVGFQLRSFAFLVSNQFKNKYDIIHVHSVPDFLVFSTIVSKLFGAKIILDIHDIMPEFYASKFGIKDENIMFKILAFVEKLSCMFADHVIIANHIWEKVLLQRSITAEKCTAIINYPDTNIFKISGEKKDVRKFIIIYPGTLGYHQGLDLAVKAFAQIAFKYPNAELHIYGDGSERNNLERLIEELEMSTRIKLYESVDHEVIAKKVEVADIGIIPKRAEGFGNEAFSSKSMEFMALGVPVLISRTTIDQLYFNDQIVTFFEPDNVNDLKEKLEHLISDSELRNRKAENAKIFIQENNWNTKVSLYMNIIEKLTDLKQADKDAL